MLIANNKKVQSRHLWRRLVSKNFRIMEMEKFEQVQPRLYIDTFIVVDWVCARQMEEGSSLQQIKKETAAGYRRESRVSWDVKNIQLVVVRTIYEVNNKYGYIVLETYAKVCSALSISTMVWNVLLLYFCCVQRSSLFNFLF